MVENSGGAKAETSSGKHICNNNIQFYASKCGLLKLQTITYSSNKTVKVPTTPSHLEQTL